MCSHTLLFFHRVLWMIIPIGQCVHIKCICLKDIKICRYFNILLVHCVQFPSKHRINVNFNETWFYKIIPKDCTQHSQRMSDQLYCSKSGVFNCNMVVLQLACVLWVRKLNWLKGKLKMCLCFMTLICMFNIKNANNYKHKFGIYMSLYFNLKCNKMQNKNYIYFRKLVALCSWKFYHASYIWLINISQHIRQHLKCKKIIAYTSCSQSRPWGPRIWWFLFQL